MRKYPDFKIFDGTFRHSKAQVVSIDGKKREFMGEGVGKLGLFKAKRVSA